jgi:hypothetical protein
MDPITLLATASALWSGLKKGIELVEDANEVFGKLGQFAGVADKLEQAIAEGKKKPKKPPLFGSLENNNDTQQAFDVFAAEHKLHQMELEIRHEFLYGAFSNLEGDFGGMDGYRKFLAMRAKIKHDRIQAKRQQEAMQKAFWDNVILWTGGTFIIVAGISITYFAIVTILEYR